MTHQAWLYSATVKDHFLHPRNVLFEDPATFPHNAEGLAGNPICGDQMLLLLNIKDDRIVDIAWKTYGCASAIASTSMLSEVVKGITLDEAYKITPQEVAEKLGGLPPNKKHCSVLGDEALRQAIDAYRQKSATLKA